MLHLQYFCPTLARVALITAKEPPHMDELADISSLSRRELEIAEAYAAGAGHRDISERLCIAPTTVRTHLQNIYRKLGVSSKIDLFRVLEDASTGCPKSQASTVLKSFPDKPSIAVLPFTNMSGDLEQEYFSDGITEDIITELARYNSLFVIARNSSFHYKGQSPNIQDVGRELGAEYMVEGSVRRAGNRVRITAQLVEAATGKHVWAERYDRDLEDIFSVQDEVVSEIVTAVPGQLAVATIRRIQRRPTDNLTAYEFLMRAIYIQYQDWGSPDAVVLLEKAIDADAQCALAYARLADWHAYSIHAHGAAADEARPLTLILAEKADQLNPNDSTILSVIGEAYLMCGDLDMARRSIGKAIKLNPNDYHVMAAAGVIFAYLGDIEEALLWNEKIIRHDPIYPASVREVSLDISYMAGRYEDAIKYFTGWHNPPRHVLAEAAAAYAQTGCHDEAAELRERYEARLPAGQTFAELLAAQMKMCALQKHRDMWLEGFRKAGFRM
jgi:TolB-like protein/DNA-binding CsgD family transcriptional regulator